MKLPRVLIITYYWPPAGGPGVQRWLGFSRHLREYGWEPVIYTPENPSYPLLDESLLKEVPEDLEILKTPIREPYRLAEFFNRKNKKFKSGQIDVAKNQSLKSKISLFIRGNFFIPDARIGWVRPSVRFLKAYLQKHPVDVLITTGPPHSLHLIGLDLKKEFPKLPWIADFRDPWTEISYFKHLRLTSVSKGIHHRLESRVLQTADLVLATSFTDAKRLEEKGAHAIPLTNGYEERPGFTESDPEKFIIGYMGVLEQLRNPQVLWDALQEILEENPAFRNKFKLKFIGKVDPQILQELDTLGLSEFVENTGYLSHEEALREAALCDLLLLTSFPDTSSAGIIPGKLFEYLSLRKPILSIGPEGADSGRILSETSAGQHFSHSEKLKIKAFILGVYEKRISFDPSGTTLYSRKNLTQKLAEILNQFQDSPLGIGATK